MPELEMCSCFEEKLSPKNGDKWKKLRVARRICQFHWEKESAEIESLKRQLAQYKDNRPLPREGNLNA